VTAYQYLSVAAEPSATVITLISHTLKLALLAELRHALHAAQTNRIILTGHDCFFAAGADIAELSALTGAGGLDYAQFGQSVFNEIADHPAMTIAAIDGYCMGGALDLALSCDLRYATPKSVLAHPGGRIGIMTGWGGTRRLPQMIGKSRTLELMTVGRRLSAAEAFEWGLVTAVVEDPLRYALER